jgi:electron transport complex protein RnfE
VIILPPGAFLVAGMLIALKNVIDGRIERRRMMRQLPVTKGAKRVRTTGAIS